MYLIFLEALGAGLILVVIVWWTMFTGRPSPVESDAGESSAGESGGESLAIENPKSAPPKK